MRKDKLYIAGSLFSEADINQRLKEGNMLESLTNFKVFNPILAPCNNKEKLPTANDIFWGDMYLLSIDIDGEEYITVKYVQKSEQQGYVRLVSQNQHHADKDVAVDKIRAIALVKASIRMNSIR